MVRKKPSSTTIPCDSNNGEVRPVGRPDEPSGWLNVERVCACPWREYARARGESMRVPVEIPEIPGPARRGRKRQN